MQVLAFEQSTGIDPSIQSRAAYCVPDRHGLSTAVIGTADLSEQNLLAIMEYRLTQYVRCGFIDPAYVRSHRLRYEPLEGVHEQDIHIVTYLHDGTILCYGSLQALPQPRPGLTLRHDLRRPLPVEDLFGWGVLNQLPLVPDIPIAEMREFIRLVKNQDLPWYHELSLRAPLELGAALYGWCLSGESQQIRLVIADLEEAVAKRTCDFFHVPSVILKNAPPARCCSPMLQRRYQTTQVHPFAFYVPDLGDQQRERLRKIEAALALPAGKFQQALEGLVGERCTAMSSLQPR